MITGKLASQIFSVLLIVIFVLADILPVQAQSPANPPPANGDFDWEKNMGRTDVDERSNISVVSSSDVYTTGGSDTSSDQMLSTNQIIIKYKASSNAHASPREIGQMQRLNHATGVDMEYLRAMSGNANVMLLPNHLPLKQVEAIIEKLMALPEIEYAEPDQLAFPMFTPDDPLYANQWDLFGDWGINVSSAWDITTGSSSIVIADIDTGITNHADLSGRIIPGYDFISNTDIANDGDGRDSDPSDPGDWVANARNSSWHGTHTAGTIGASGNNSLGITGINWNSKILPIRVLGRGGGYQSDVIDGMRWAAGLFVSGVPSNPNPARVLNMSLGGSGACSKSYRAAINEITSAGTVIVVAAGNNSVDASKFQPASCNGVITVAATDINGSRASYSNYGTSVEISAPGGAQSYANDPNVILSTLNTGTTIPEADTYIYYQGTSMATPHVTGVVSLMLSVNPSLTPAQVLQILQSFAKPFPGNSTCNTSICGSGILDAGAAVDAVTHVLIFGNAGTMGVTLNYTDSTPKTAIAGSNGGYSFIVSDNWSGTVTPSKVGYTFSPADRSYSNVLENQISQDYVATAITYNISGNAGTAGATLSYMDGTPKIVIADDSGNYFLAVSYGWSGTVSPFKTGYIFSPANMSYANVLADQTLQDYTATAHMVEIRYAKPSAVGAGDCADWDNACTLQTALATAISGDEVWVVAGTHKPTTGTDRTATFQLKSGVTIYGGFTGTETDRSQRDYITNVTILSGDLNGDDVGFTNNSENVYHVVTGAIGATLDGFTVTAGNANGSIDCHGVGCGGGMYNTSGVSPSLTNIVFSSNSAKFYGGGMYNEASSPSLTNVTFSVNLAKQGGGMYNETSNPTLTSVTFSGNSANYGAGMYNNNNSNPTLTSVAFSSNLIAYLFGNGGGMYNKTSNPTLTSVTFSGNSAMSYGSSGGGIYNEWSSPILTDVTFSSNSAEISGGGMFNISDSNPTLTNVTFSGNSAGFSSGGGMYNEASSPTLTSVTFSNNSASQRGGGMGNVESNPILTDVTFNDNLSENYYGGGMSNSSGSSPMLTNVTFNNNSAKEGGGMSNIESNPILMNVTFSKNFAIYGGGVFNDYTSNPTLTAVTISGNSATFGGGMYNYRGSSPMLMNVSFNNNSAYSTGGGLSNMGSNNPILTNVTFNGNSANFGGGGMYNIAYSNSTLTNVTFSGNSANFGGGISNQLSNLVLTNVTFSGNLANYGGGISNWNSSMIVQNSIFWGDHGGEIYDEIDTSNINTITDSVVQGWYAGTNIITADPMLGTLGNYGGFTQTIPLLAGSSAIDTGNDTICSAAVGAPDYGAGGLDQRGIARPQGAHCDIGAFELVDATAPETTIDGKPADPDSDSTPTFTFSGNDGIGSGIVAFMCRMDGGTYTTCASPFTSPALNDGPHTFDVYAVDMLGNADASPASHTWTLETIFPTVTSISRANPNPTSAANVDFTVTFSENVTGVDTSDFNLTTTGSVSGATVSGISGTGSTYTVTVNTGTGYGTLRLNVVDDNSIVDGTGNPLGGATVGDGNFATGEVYIVDKTGGDTTGVFRPSNGVIFLKNANTSGFADININYGMGGDYPIVGDWDGDGKDTIGVYRNGVFYLRNSNTVGFADISFAFGTPGDQPIAGDWNGDGFDTVGVFHDATVTFYLRNQNTAGAPDTSFQLGLPGDVGIAGDWDGDGMDTTGVFRPSNGVIFLKNTNTTGFADVALNYGIPGDQPVTGDWDSDGADTIGVFRNGQFFLRNSNTVGYADIVFALGFPTDMPIAGNWDGQP